MNYKLSPSLSTHDIKQCLRRKKNKANLPLGKFRHSPTFKEIYDESLSML
jgi:hypothetical protein